MELQPYLDGRFQAAIGNWARYSVFSFEIVQWSMLVSFSSAFLITTLTCVFIVSQRSNFGPAQAGLALTYSFLIPYIPLLQCITQHT
jgi:hypothetical protein